MRYRAELENHGDSVQEILRLARRGNVTLLFSSHDVEHNNAVALSTYLNERLETSRGGRLSKSLFQN
jgi:uncharacterized protein YeaO (DUF488 family)